MSRNLIDILFQTEKDKERVKIRREKEKIKGIRHSSKATSRVSAAGRSRADSRYE